MEQYEFTTPNGTKFTITSEEVSNGWLTQVEVVNKKRRSIQICLGKSLRPTYRGRKQRPEKDSRHRER